MLALLQDPGDIEWQEDVPPASADGMIFIRVVQGGTFIPYKDTRRRTPDGLPVFRYAM